LLYVPAGRRVRHGTRGQQRLGAGVVIDQADRAFVLRPRRLGIAIDGRSNARRHDVIVGQTRPAERVPPRRVVDPHGSARESSCELLESRRSARTDSRQVDVSAPRGSIDDVAEVVGDRPGRCIVTRGDRRDDQVGVDATEIRAGEHAAQGLERLHRTGLGRPRREQLAERLGERAAVVGHHGTIGLQILDDASARCAGRGDDRDIAPAVVAVALELLIEDRRELGDPVEIRSHRLRRVDRDHDIEPLRCGARDVEAGHVARGRDRWRRQWLVDAADE